jgi:translation initiation factor 2 beta subunit (eIF-2beta)/eIF-5
MSHANSTPAPAESPPRGRPRPVRDEHRVIYHEPICPQCGSFDITEAEADTGDGITEIALTCQACGTAWPVACVVEWS